MPMQPGRDGIAIYHVVLAHEDFDQTAHKLLQLLRKAEQRWPGQKRSLYLDIEGHRNAAGGFDNDMLELQTKFATEFLLPFLSRAAMPLATLQNPQPQKGNIPDELKVVAQEDLEKAVAVLLKHGKEPEVKRVQLEIKAWKRRKVRPGGNGEPGR